MDKKTEEKLSRPRCRRPSSTFRDHGPVSVGDRFLDSQDAVWMVVGWVRFERNLSNLALVSIDGADPIEVSATALGYLVRL